MERYEDSMYNIKTTKPQLISLSMDDPYYKRRGDSIRRFKLKAMTRFFFVIIAVEDMTVYHLKLYSRFIPAIECMLYSQITVAHVTQQKAVLSATLLFVICNLKE